MNMVRLQKGWARKNDMDLWVQNRLAQSSQYLLIQIAEFFH